MPCILGWHIYIYIPVRAEPDIPSVMRGFIASCALPLSQPLTHPPLALHTTLSPQLINDKLFQASPSVQLSPRIVYFNKFVLIANNNILQDLRESLALTCVQIHMSMEDLSTRYFEDTGRHYFITRSSFLKLLGAFAHIVRSREDTLQTKR